jgi:hypothetical protein
VRLPEVRGDYSNNTAVAIQDGRGLDRLKPGRFCDRKVRLELRIGADVIRGHAPAQSERAPADAGVIGAHHTERFQKTFGEAALHADLQTLEGAVVDLDVSSDGGVLFDGGIQDFEKRFARLVRELQRQKAKWNERLLNRV